MGTRRRHLVLLAAVFFAGFTAGATAHWSGLLHLLHPASLPTQQSGGPAAYLAARRALQRAFPVKGRYVMVGDSITEHMTDWRGIFPGIAVVNLGIGGDTTLGVLARLDSIAATGAETAVLLIGINDLMIMKSKPEDIAVRHAEIRRGLIQAGMRVAVISLFTGMPGLRDAVADVNARLERSCQPPACTFVDLNTTMSEAGVLKPRYTYDGLHLNAEGYRAWVERIAHLVK